MTEREPIETTNLDIYGDPALPWSRVQEQLSAAQPEDWTPDNSTQTFLGTVRPDGRPHAAPVGAIWHDGDYYFVSSPKSRKVINVEANPASTMSVRLSGIDVVLEGESTRVTDPALLATICARYNKDGWPAEVEGDAFTAPFSAPSAGPPPWYVYRFRPHTVFGVATREQNGDTRWRFE